MDEKKIKESRRRPATLVRKKREKIEEPAQGLPKDEKIRKTESKPLVERKWSNNRSQNLSSSSESSKGEEKPGYQPRANQYLTLPDGTTVLDSKKRFASKKVTRNPRSVLNKESRFLSGPGPALNISVKPDEIDKDEEYRLNLSAIKLTTAKALNYIKTRMSVKPKTAIILGSGLGAIADAVTSNREEIDFGKIPGFTKPTVLGHAGLLVTGKMDKEPVIISAGRPHFYETANMYDAVFHIKTILALDVEQVILTTAAGAINSSFRRGDMMIIKDHINLMGDNPLFERDISDERIPFIDMSNCYDDKVLGKVPAFSRKSRASIKKGVLAAVRGPIFETGAEKKMLKILGADAVSMSLIPETIVASYVNIKPTGIAVITNELNEKARTLDHKDVITTARRYIEDLKLLILSILRG